MFLYHKNYLGKGVVTPVSSPGKGSLEPLLSKIKNSLSMARPKISDSKLLNKHLPPVRCTEEEMEIIKRRAKLANLTLSQFVRQTVLDGKVTVVKPSSKLEKNFELVNQLKRIGNNVNQISKNMNIFNSPATADHKAVWQKLDLILDKVIASM